MTREEIIESIKKDPFYLECVETQDEELCLIAVKQYGGTLEFVKNKTKKIILEALKSEGLALYLIQEQTEELCFAAVQQNAWALQFVKNQTPLICLEALKKDATAWKEVRIVPNPDFKTTLQNLKKKQLILESI